jgi:hypothetical protein
MLKQLSAVAAQRIQMLTEDEEENFFFNSSDDNAKINGGGPHVAGGVGGR